MNWGWIKKSINSTLGTKDFKPLDEILHDGITSLKELLRLGTIIPLKSRRLEPDWEDLNLTVIDNTYAQYSHQNIEDGYYLYEVKDREDGIWYNFLVGLGENSAHAAIAVDNTALVATNNTLSFLKSGTRKEIEKTRIKRIL